MDPHADGRSAAPGRRFGGRVAALLVTALAVLVLDAAPAAAHGVGGPSPTDYRTVVDGVRPPLPGVTVRVTDVSSRIELRNRGTRDVVVLGYQGEPYLRVGPGGAFENVRSPATYLNRSTVPAKRAPASYDATAAPEWRRISATPVVRWHDHRAHWMGASRPPQVARDPGRRHVVIAGWRIPLRSGTTRAAITGDVVWEPAPSPWPWLLGAVGIGAALVLLARGRRARVVVATTLAIVLASELVHVAGAWGASTSGTGRRLLESVYSVLALAFAAGALVQVIRRGVHAAAPLVLVAGIALALAGGLADVGSLTHSQIPSTLPPGVARLSVALALGLGTGLAVVGARHLATPRPVPRASASTPS